MRFCWQEGTVRIQAMLEVTQTYLMEQEGGVHAVEVPVSDLLSKDHGLQQVLARDLVDDGVEAGLQDGACGFQGIQVLRTALLAVQQPPGAAAPQVQLSRGQCPPQPLTDARALLGAEPLLCRQSAMTVMWQLCGCSSVSGLQWIFT